MIGLETRVRELAFEEKKEAIKEHGCFHSNHEALAILQKEIWEAEMEAEKVKKNEEILKIAIYTNLFDSKDGKVIADCTIKSLKDRAVRGACELIQVAAMCDKFIESRQERGDE